MKKRANIDAPAFLVFTRDYHQLVRGKLLQGNPCTLSYDPVRIIPVGEPYIFGDPNRPIVAHLQFHPNGPILDLTLVSWAGTLEHAPTTISGHGPMLKAIFDVPTDAEWIIIWFTYVSSWGETHYDSANGANYSFRFIQNDVDLIKAEVTEHTGMPLASFSCQVAASSSVQSLTARYRFGNAPAEAETEVALQSTTQTTPEELTVWEVNNVVVPSQSVMIFDLVYYIDGKRFKDDNQGFYYIAAEPAELKKAGIV